MDENSYERYLDTDTGILLTPGCQGANCKGNGKDGSAECCCDNCDYFLECFPQWIRKE